MNLPDSPLELQQLALDPGTPPAMLDELAIRVELRALVAANPAASPQLLSRLSGFGDPRVKQAVVSNPNTPLELLKRLASEYPEQFLLNPALPLYMLDQPGFLLSLSLEALKRIVIHPETPRGVLGVLTQHQRPEIAEAARHHVNLAGEAGPGWEKELETAVWGLRLPQTIPSHLSTLLEINAVQPWLIPPLIICDSLVVRGAAAQSPLTPPELLRALRQLGADAELSGVVPPDPSIDPAWLERFITGGNWSSGLVAQHPATPPTLLERLSTHSFARVRRLVVENPNTPVRVLITLAGDSDEKVRQSVARNPRTPSTTMLLLANDAHASVCIGVAQNPNADIQLLEQLARSKEWKVRKAVAQRHDLPEQLLEQLGFDEEPQVYYEIARQLDLPPHLRERMVGRSDPVVEGIMASVLAAAAANQAARPVPQPAQATHQPLTQARSYQPDSSRPGQGAAAPPPASSPAAESRRAVAEDPATPATTLRELAADHDQAVRDAVARNPATPPETLAELASGRIGSTRDHRLAVAMNPSTPTELFEELITGLGSDVALRHPRTPEPLKQEILERVLRQVLTRPWQPPAIVYAVILAHPACPPDILEQRSRNFDWIERYAIVRNPAARLHLLEQLAQDVHQLVRAAARAALAARKQELP